MLLNLMRGSHGQAYKVSSRRDSIEYEYNHRKRVSVRITSFEGRNVCIFGGSSGIGLEVAKQLSGLGAHIVIFARGETKLRQAVIDIEKERHGNHQKVEYQSVDISVHQDVENSVRAAVEKLGNPDILINCAGRAVPDYFENISFSQFEETMKINLFGMWSSVSAVLPYMKENGGVIVNTSSVAGFLGTFGYVDYAASKFGIIGFSEALRSEVKRHNISVSILCPPDTQTPGFDVENETKPKETKAISDGAGVLGVEKVVAILIRDLKKGKKMIIPGFDAKVVYYLKRWCPALVDFVMDRTVLKTQEKMGL